MSEQHAYQKLKEIKVRMNDLNNQVNEIVRSLKVAHNHEKHDHKKPIHTEERKEEVKKFMKSFHKQKK